MRNCILLLLIALVIDGKSQVVNLTPKIGLSCANMFWGGIPRGNLKPGISLGSSFEYKISEKKYLESGLRFIQKGASFTLDQSFSSDYVTQVHKYTLNYLEIPVSLILLIDQHNKCFLDIGLCTGYLVQGNEQDKKTYRTGPPSKSKSKLDMSRFKRFDFGLQMGGGYKIKVTAVSRIKLEAYYDLSFTTLYGEWYSDLVKRNLVYNLFIGYEFDI